MFMNFITKLDVTFCAWNIEAMDYRLEKLLKKVYTWIHKLDLIIYIQGVILILKK